MANSKSLTVEAEYGFPTEKQFLAFTEFLKFIDAKTIGKDFTSYVMYNLSIDPDSLTTEEHDMLYFMTRFFNSLNE